MYNKDELTNVISIDFDMRTMAMGRRRGAAVSSATYEDNGSLADTESSVGGDELDVATLNAATDAGTIFDEMTETLFAAAQVVLFTAFRISKADKIITPMDLAYTFAATASEDVCDPARRHIVDAAATLERRPLEVNLETVKSRVFATPIAITKMRELNPACGWTAIEVTIAGLVKQAYCAQTHFVAIKAKEKLLAAGITAETDVQTAREILKEIPEFINGRIHSTSSPNCRLSRTIGR